MTALRPGASPAAAGLIAITLFLLYGAKVLTLADAVLDPAQRDMAEVQRSFTACFDSQDYREGRKAFMEKRDPMFQGR